MDLVARLEADPARTKQAGRAGGQGTSSGEVLATMVGVTVCLLPLLTPAGPGNTAVADVGIAGCIVLAALWTTREHLSIRFPYLVGVIGLMLGGAIAAYTADAPASVGLVLAQDFFLVLWVAVLALGRHRVTIVSAATHAWCRTTVIYSAVMVLAYLVGFDQLAGVSARDGVRASYTFGDPNLAANYLVVSLLMMAACQRPRAPGVRRASYLVVLVAIGFTGSNGAMLSLALAAVLCIAVGRYRRFGSLSGVTTLVAVGAVAIVLVGLVLPMVNLSQLRQNAAGSIPLLRDSIGRSDGSSSERAAILVEGYSLYLAGDATGVGPSRTKASLAHSQAAYVKEAHNDYLATLLERGLVGVVGLIALGLTVLVRCSRLLVGRLPDVYAAVVPRVELLVVIAPVTALASSFYEVLHFRHVWTWLGLVAALSLAMKDGRESTR